jgi:hypothetical protein
VPTLLLQGETGTGKGLVARIVHDSGPRASGPFIPVNCAAIPETMLEAELFGHEAGAFTDARRGKAGLFDAASGGTLFLDEIDSLALPLQSKLLTAIESKRIRRLGAVTEHAVDVKLIAATQQPVGELRSHEPWTEAARWERAIAEKLTGFGGVLVQRNPSLLVWAFGLPRALEQVVQRAVHGACAVRNLTGPSTSREQAPQLRIAVHLGTMLVDTAAADPVRARCQWARR